MAQGNSSRKWPCDCAAVFNTPQSIGEHIQTTGHMKPRWCTLCNRLFPSKESLSQHKRTAAKHKKSPAVPPKVNANVPVSDKKTQAERPKATPKKLAQIPKTAKAPNTAVGSSQNWRNRTTTTSITTKNSTKSNVSPRNLIFYRQSFSINLIRSIYHSCQSNC